MTLVGFDADVMVWGVLQKKQRGFEDMLTRVPAFLRKLDDEGVRVIVPSIVAAELLYDLPPERHESFLAALNRNFIVAPFDMKAASAFSKLWRERRTDGTVKALQNDDPVRTRTELKADAMIIATVISRGVREFYSHDDGVVKIAGSRLPVYKIPVIAEQTDLFPERALKLVAQPSQKPGGGSTS